MSAEEKTKAFRLFDFENNERWKEYLLRIDISGPGYNEKLLKLKAKWYKREVDADFDLAWLAKHGAADLNSPASTTKHHGGEGGQTSSAAPSPSDPSTSVPRSTVPSQQKQQPLTITALHFAILITGLASLLPLCPQFIHRLFLQLVVLSSILKIGHQFGWPKFTPLTELKLWVPTRLVFIPSTILAAYHAFHFLNGRFSNRALWKRYGEKAFKFMASRQNDAALLNAVSEIGTGFVMLLQMFTPTRNVLITVMYWQWLRMRYWSPDSAAIHRQAWANIGHKVDPLLKMIPILRIPINLVQRWFTQRPV